MPLPQYRETGYEDDGVDGFQCLNCMERFGMRYGTFNFCPACGLQVTKRECRKSNVPRWVYDRYGNDELPFEITEKIWYRTRLVLLPRWVIECRAKWSGEGFGNWQTSQRLRDLTAHQAFKHLQDCRARNDDEDEKEFLTKEYRIVIDR